MPRGVLFSLTDAGAAGSSGLFRLVFLPVFHKRCGREEGGYAERRGLSPGCWAGSVKNFRERAEAGIIPASCRRRVFPGIQAGQRPFQAGDASETRAQDIGGGFVHR